MAGFMSRFCKKTKKSMSESNGINNNNNGRIKICFTLW